MNHRERRHRRGIERRKEIISKKAEEESLVQVFEKRLIKPGGEIQKIEPTVEMIAEKKKAEYLSSLDEEIKKYEAFDPGDFFGKLKKTPHFHLRHYSTELNLKRLERINTKVYEEIVVKKYLDPITHRISALGYGLNEIKECPENMIDTYFPMLKIARGGIEEKRG
jgi:hypothetical protein